jgi:hypothetical protein
VLFLREVEQRIIEMRQTKEAIAKNAELIASPTKDVSPADDDDTPTVYISLSPHTHTHTRTYCFVCVVSDSLVVSE